MSSIQTSGNNSLAAPGTLSSMHKVYEDPIRPNKWTKQCPESVGPPIEDAESAQHALVVRYKFSTSMDPAKELALHSIVIQSPGLKQLLGRILDGYPGITLELDRLEFIAPFECFVQRWERLIAVQTELEADAESQAKLDNECSDLAHLRLLRSVLYEELASILRTRQDLLKHGVMTSAHIWTIYEPGCLIYTKSDAHDRVYRLKTAKWEIANRSKHYKLECEFVDYDGDKFGFCTETIYVASWKGTKKITKLEAYPLLFHDDLESMQARLSERGRKFEAYKGFHFVGYKGVAIGKAGRGEAKLPKYDVNSRIIIDSAASNKFDGKISMEYLDTEEVYEDAVDLAGDNDEIDDDCVVLEKDSLGINAGGKMPKIEAHTRSALTTEQLLLTSPKARGYSLRDKKWMSFYIESVHDIVWNEDAFESLVAPQEQKDLILAFAEAQSKTRANFDDFIQGKGKGIIMLLAGPPGVGKTLTAESVAEAMRVPLYSIGAAELGSKPAHLEKKLEDILLKCAKWNAVLLLDEADVFMEARSSQDLDRNKLVAIFLRLLEYFEGIMFLTTNRLEQMDSAFESRIHLTLNYSELDRSSRRQVWSKFLSRDTGTDEINTITEADLDKLAKTQLNGRQIKNVLKTAQLLADRYKEGLGMSHLDTVLKLRKANEKRTASFFGGE